ncbi:MAG TPA: hypothetical protein VFZ75_01370 [Actinomycetota bacterium]|nr:hypothetical protein [Actinomycetota bacterium]
MLLGSVACQHERAEAPVARSAPRRAPAVDRLPSVLLLESDRPTQPRYTRLHDPQRPWVRVTTVVVAPAGAISDGLVVAALPPAATAFDGPTGRSPPSTADD